ncbi:carbohydrate binding domain-containing protein [Paenibacillus sp.]|uniref:carbohydrate binding domain-containing protein n=1 Tax=Paenibacillus sp. TaxID=58172 RepID=UPI002811B09F|nr:carbohydrate binding domain-containing protein [Paenibacillus sp.]
MKRRFLMQGLACTLAAGLALSTLLPASATAEKGKTEKPLWTQVWGDEFDDGAIDRSKWTFDLTNGESVGNPGWGNNELQYYTDRADNVKEENGKLVITARKEAYEGFSYTSARIKTKGLFSKAYGKFEIRASAPTGKGLWPAIWMLPEDYRYGGWAASGEIDIMEGWGSRPRTVAGTIHYGSQWPNNTYTGKEYELPNGSTIQDFHTYAIEWEPGEIRWYVDGVLFNTQNDWYSVTAGQPANNAYPAPFDEKFHLLINLAVGGNFDGDPTAETPFPSSFVIDYVRVYELTGRPYREPVPPSIPKEAYLPGAKLPLSDGNLVYNNDFTMNEEGDPGMGIPGTAHWALYEDPGASADVTIEPIDGGNFAKIAIQSAGVNSYSIQPQSIVSLAKGRFYKLTFDAKTDTTRNMNVRVTGGASRGYAGYSQGLTAALDGELRTYEMTFQMKQESDNAARIEFNLGTNDRPVWIGRARLVEIEGIPFDHDSPKAPLGDGNHVYNGTFDLGEPNRMSFWHVLTVGKAAATASVDPEARELVVDVSKGGQADRDVRILQRGLSLLDGHDYALTFDAEASNARELVVALVDADGGVIASTPVSLKSPKRKREIAVAFDDVAVFGDPGAQQLVFFLGGKSGSVRLDNVKLLRTSVYFPSDTAFYPLRNGDFGAGLQFWGAAVDSGGSASAAAANGEANVTVVSQGVNPWSAMFIQGGLPMKGGLDYVVSFDARATVARKVEVIAENASYRRYFDRTIDVGTDPKSFRFEFRMPQDDTVDLKFLLGLIASTTAVPTPHDVTLDNITLEVKDAPVARPPTLIQDSTNNRVGQPIELTFGDDAAWRGAIRSVAVNGAPAAYAAAKGTLELASSNFTGAGNYTVSVKAEGYAEATAKQAVLAADGNLVANGSFDDGTAGWSTWSGEGGAATLRAEAGAGKIDVHSAGWQSWANQLYQEGIPMSAGKAYELKFTASSTVDRPIVVEFTNTSGGQASFPLTAEPTVFAKTFAVSSASPLKLNFLLGNVSFDGTATPGEAHTITLDDIQVREIEQ